LQRSRKRSCATPPRRSARILAADIRQRRKRQQGGVKEPAEPGTLAFARLADAVHAIVPVARPEQRDSVDANRQAMVERPRAVFEDRATLLGDRGHKERFILAGTQFRTVKEGDRLVENAQLACHLYIMSDCEGQPDAIVGDAGADSLSRGRKPPMLHVASDKLARRRADQLLPRRRGLRHRQRHHVLELIAKAVRAARLVEGRSSPDAACQGLIQQPSIEHEVHRTVWSLYLNGV